MVDDIHAEPDSISKRVAGEIRAEMGRAKITGPALAARLGVRYPTLAPKLSGRRCLTVDDLGAIAKALGVPMERLTRVELETAAA